ncbi:MAG: hypothetical protein WCP73_00485 [Eubacteriales bacterium]
MKKERNYKLNVKAKNRNKAIRTVFEVVAISALVLAIVFLVVNIRQYQEPDKSKWTNKSGFVALTYFGVNHVGSSKSVSQSTLDKELKALSGMGYQTVSQQDIVDFYKNGKALPQKALYLGFEDGRTDSSIFAQSLLERYNYKATLFSYANRVDGDDNKFLNAKQLLDLTRNGYWELGSNGYRLTYIDITDRNNNHIPMIDDSKYNEIETAQSYTHFLMDFLRDRDGVPTEDRQEMELRIQTDYDNMKSIYTKGLGYVPGAYIIMHSDEMYGNMNPLVQSANEQGIKQLFQMNFNKDLNCYNTPEENMLNLNRLQVGAYWYTNHLLMAIKRDSSGEMQFLKGDADRAENWDVQKGVAEFLGNKIAFTSPPKSDGFMVLKSDKDFSNITLNTTLTGTVVGNECIYLRYADNGNSFVRVRCSNNQIIVEEKLDGQLLKTLSTYNMDLPDFEKLNGPSQLQQQYLYNTDGTINEDAPQPYLMGLSKVTQLRIDLQGKSLQLTVDGKASGGDIQIDSGITGKHLALGTWRSRINKKDDIYDAVFQNLTVTTPGDKGTILYENTYNFWQGIIVGVEDAFNALINWSITAF